MYMIISGVLLNEIWYIHVPIIKITHLYPLIVANIQIDIVCSIFGQFSLFLALFVCIIDVDDG